MPGGWSGAPTERGLREHEKVSTYASRSGGGGGGRGIHTSATQMTARMWRAQVNRQRQDNLDALEEERQLLIEQVRNMSSNSLCNLVFDYVDWKRRGHVDWNEMQDMIDLSEWEHGFKYPAREWQNADKNEDGHLDMDEFQVFGQRASAVLMKVCIWVMENRHKERPPIGRFYREAANKQSALDPDAFTAKSAWDASGTGGVAGVTSALNEGVSNVNMAVGQGWGRSANHYVEDINDEDPRFNKQSASHREVSPALMAWRSAMDCTPVEDDCVMLASVVVAHHASHWEQVILPNLIDALSVHSTIPRHRLHRFIAYSPPFATCVVVSPDAIESRAQMMAMNSLGTNVNYRLLSDVRKREGPSLFEGFHFLPKGGGIVHRNDAADAKGRNIWAFPDRSSHAYRRDPGKGAYGVTDHQYDDELEEGCYCC